MLLRLLLGGLSLSLVLRAAGSFSSLIECKRPAAAAAPQTWCWIWRRGENLFSSALRWEMFSMDLLTSAQVFSLTWESGEIELKQLLGEKLRKKVIGQFLWSINSIFYKTFLMQIAYSFTNFHILLLLPVKLNNHWPVVFICCSWNPVYFSLCTLIWDGNKPFNVF